MQWLSKLVFDVVSILDRMMLAVSRHKSRYQLEFSESKILEIANYSTCQILRVFETAKLVKLLDSAIIKYLLPLLCRPPTFEQLVAVCLVTPIHIHDLIPVRSPMKKFDYRVYWHFTAQFGKPFVSNHERCQENRYWLSWVFVGTNRSVHPECINWLRNWPIFRRYIHHDP